MDNFLVLSIGRTATKWLAATLGVPHEPISFTGQAASPRHLYLMATSKWRPPRNTNIIVMTRDARDQVLSVINRMHAVDLRRLDVFRRLLPTYLQLLNAEVRHGARVLAFEDLIHAQDQGMGELSRLCLDYFNCTAINSCPPANQHPKKVTKLPPWGEKAAAQMQRYYDSWTLDEALEDPIDPTRHTIRYGGKVYQMDYVFPAEIAALRAHRSGQFQELPVLEWVKSLQLGGTYIDAGAHIGNHTLFFVNHCPSKRVIGIEAHPQIFGLLDGNLMRNATPRIWEIYNRAAWNVTGMSIAMAPIPKNNAGHTHVRDSGGRKGERGDAVVDSMTIDSLLIEDATVLKIDVEDVEEQAIQGAVLTIQKTHPVIIAERHSKKQLDDFEALIKPYGYQRTKEWAGINSYAWQC